MRGWTALFIKDGKLILRNRLLLVVLVIYPFLIMGIMGAAFYDAGRPVPLGLVDLDRAEEGGIAWLGATTDEVPALERRFRYRAVRVEEFGSCEEAEEALSTGRASMVLAIMTDGESPRWLGADLTADQVELTLEDVREASSMRDYSSFQEALEPRGGERNDLVLALREKEYPHIGESIWLDKESYDASGLIMRFSSGVAEVTEYESEEEAREALARGGIDAVIVLPRAFVYRLKALNETAIVPVIIDQSNLVKAEFAETSIRGFLSRVKDGVAEEKMRAVVAGLYVLVTGGDFFGTEVVGLGQIRENLETIKGALADRPELAELVEGGIDLATTVIEDIEEAADYLKGTALPVELDISSTAGRTLSAKDAAVPALIALSILWTGVLCGAILMVVEDEEGMRERIALTETGPLALVGSKLLLATVVVFAQSAVMLVLAVAAFGVFASNALLALLVIAAASFSCIGIGLVIAAFARQVAAAVIMSVLVSFPLIFMTGAVYPLSQMPSFMQWLAHAVPLTYAIDALSGVMLRGEGLADVAGRVGILLAFGVGLLAAGSMLARRRDAG
ncbi:MAG: ABC transporter permease [Actinobacteria bacterium]|nr:ABC transporter permease [Actinomycetota bacterium]